MVLPRIIAMLSLIATFCTVAKLELTLKTPLYYFFLQSTTAGFVYKSLQSVHLYPISSNASKHFTIERFVSIDFAGNGRPLNEENSWPAHDDQLTVTFAIPYCELYLSHPYLRGIAHTVFCILIEF